VNAKSSKPWLGGGFNRKKTPRHVKHIDRISRRPVDFLSEEDSSADEWDKIGLRELVSGPHKEYYLEQSPYQNIQLLGASDLRLYLNGQLQFSSLDERIYHEAFVHIPFALTNEKDRILILGGGDGLALREVLKYREVKHVDLVDIDEKVLYAAKQVQPLVRLNEDALSDKRVKVHAKDALTFINKSRKKYNVIIVDFPDPTDETLAKLYTVEVFQTINQLLSDQGVLVCQSNSPEETPVVYWSIGKTMEQAGFETTGYHTIVPSFGDWGFQLGTKQPLPAQPAQIPVAQRTLPADLDSLFHFPAEWIAYQQEAIVNSQDNVKLHEIFNSEIKYQQ
jgi:spermidine synthase